MKKQILEWIKSHPDSYDKNHVLIPKGSMFFVNGKTRYLKRDIDISYGLFTQYLIVVNGKVYFRYKIVFTKRFVLIDISHASVIEAKHKNNKYPIISKFEYTDGNNVVRIKNKTRHDVTLIDGTTLSKTEFRKIYDLVLTSKMLRKYIKFQWSDVRITPSKLSRLTKHPISYWTNGESSPYKIWYGNLYFYVHSYDCSELRVGTYNKYTNELINEEPLDYDLIRLKIKSKSNIRIRNHKFLTKFIMKQRNKFMKWGAGIRINHNGKIFPIKSKIEFAKQKLSCNGKSIFITCEELNRIYYSDLGYTKKIPTSLSEAFFDN